MDLKLYHRVLFGEIFGLVSDSDKGLFVITFWRKLESNEILESGAFEPAEIAEKDLTLCLEALNLTDLFVLDFLFWGVHPGLRGRDQASQKKDQHHFRPQAP